MMLKDILFTVTENRPAAEGIWALRLRSEEGGTVPTPGQFAMIKIRESALPLLRRPFSYAGAAGTEILFLYKIAGEGTRLLSQTRENSAVKILGPLGRGFDLSLAKKKALLAGGGIGFAPLLYLADILAQEQQLEVEFLVGAKSVSMLPAEFITERITQNVKVFFATEDGSIGHRGMVSDLLQKKLADKTDYDVIYSCGPMPMLEAVADIAREYGIPCECSVEARMACGVGACMSCVLPDSEGEYLGVCRDGPVFKAKQLFGKKSNA